MAAGTFAPLVLTEVVEWLLERLVEFTGVQGVKGWHIGALAVLAVLGYHGHHIAGAVARGAAAARIVLATGVVLAGALVVLVATGQLDLQGELVRQVVQLVGGH
jgi:hypothetical protein